MIRKKLIGLILLIVSLNLFLISLPQITGNAIGYQIKSSFNLIIIILFFASLILLTSKKSLEAIIIPTAAQTQEDIERASVGRKYHTNSRQYFIISGGRSERPLNESERADIYRELRQTEALKRYGKQPEIKPSQITIEGHSSDTVENVLYSLKKLRPETDRITFVSYPMHLRRIRMIMQKARKEGLVPEGLKEKYVPTRQNLQEFVYGTIALAQTKYKLRHGLEEARKNKTGKFGNFIKRLISD